jgi:hypothetical protein
VFDEVAENRHERLVVEAKLSITSWYRSSCMYVGLLSLMASAMSLTTMFIVGEGHELVIGKDMPLPLTCIHLFRVVSRLLREAIADHLIGILGLIICNWNCAKGFASAHGVLSIGEAEGKMVSISSQFAMAVFMKSPSFE